MLLEISLLKFQGIKGQNYNSNKFSNNKAILMITLRYSPIQLRGFMDYTFTPVIINTIQYNTILLLLLEWVEFQKIVPRPAPVVTKISNLLNIGFFKYDALASF